MNLLLEKNDYYSVNKISIYNRYIIIYINGIKDLISNKF